MTSQENTSEQAVDDRNKADSNGKEVTGDARNRTITALLIILLIAFTLITAGGGYFLWNRLQAIEIDVAAASRAIQQVKNNRDMITQLESGLGELQARQQSLDDALSRLMQERPKDNQDWALAEVEYLLVIAMHRLLLEHDVSTALAALEAADRRLRDLHMPGVIPVREQIAADMNKLKAVETVDISGLAVYMADLIDRSAELPLRNDPVAAEQPGTSQVGTGNGTSGWRNFLGNIWNELKSLVVIKHEGELTQALLLPDQEYFLYQNLRLELENARYAILRRDTANFQASIELVSGWLKTYFDTSSTAVMNILDSLRQMSVLKLEVELPDISSSLESLRATIRQNESGDGNSQQ